MQYYVKNGMGINKFKNKLKYSSLTNELVTKIKLLNYTLTKLKISSLTFAITKNSLTK